MKKFLLPIIAMTVVISSCQKKKSINPNPNPSIANSSSHGLQTEMASVPYFTETQIDSIGLYHNIFSTEAIDNFAFNTGNDSIELITDYLNIGLSELNSPQDSLEKYLIAVNNPDSNWSSLIESFSNPAAAAIINDSKSYVFNTENMNYEELLEFINNEKDLANSNLDGNDRFITLSFLSILEKSCYLWMPADLGGSGIGDRFITNWVNSKHGSRTSISTQAQSGETERKINWKSVGLADASAAYAAYREVGWIADFGPEGVEYVIAYCGWCAAYASAQSVALQMAGF